MHHLPASRVKVPKGLRHVPGPRGLPIVGNTFQLGEYPHRTIIDWSRKYGELFKIRIGYENWVFINSPSAVREIMDRQSAVTSGRQQFPVLMDIISGGKRFLFMNYTPKWRRLRATVHRLLTPKASQGFRPSQEFEAKQLIHDILTDNANQENFYMHVRRYTTSVVMTSTYGRRVPVWDCEDVREIYGLMKEFSENARPGAFLADVYPPLVKLPIPLQWWRARALRYYRRQRDIWMKYWNTLETQIAQNVAPECFVRQWHDAGFEKQNVDNEQAAFVAGTMIEAGSETTSAALNIAIKYLAAFPEAQRAAHEELARVIGESQSPTFEDEPSLPYIRAMVKETLRIRPVTTMGSPHYTTSDVTYKDFFIPKNTVVSLSQYAIHYDPARWDDPEKFDPSRYLSYPLTAGAYAASGDANARDHFDFGAGRRICPGMHLAENSLFITLSKILWAFEIRPPFGSDAKEEEVDVSDAAFEPGMNTLPKPYKIRFVARSPAIERTLREEWKVAQENGFMLGNVRVDTAGMMVS
ncbi:putative O-methylsterigmatocystin oxidoreductase [Pyrenochaeta sp. MPI-SDFR-AT-0127]|nr:putative O-methylsterigmatocystin oxidoreductase [Pyrenochaeta sp. MPI-SDFR-AT-0127]